MCASAEKPAQEPGIDPPEFSKKPVSRAHDDIPCSRPSETLIERVVDFMNTYDEN
jgi:hypothetical protein